MSTIVVGSPSYGIAVSRASQELPYPSGYVPAKSVAIMLRKRFAQEFPGAKFSVVTDHGTCVRVRYVDGPALDAVEGIAAPYRGGGFDGMIDLEYHRYSYLAPDGVTMAFGPCAGTAGSLGSVPPEHFGAPAPDWRRVRSGATYIFVEREWTAEGAGAFASWAKERYPWALPVPFTVSQNWQGKERANFDAWRYCDAEPFGRTIMESLSKFDARTGTVEE